MIFDKFVCNNDINFLTDRIELSIKTIRNEHQALALKNYIELANKYIKRKYPQEYNYQLQFLLLQFEVEVEDYLTKLKYLMYFNEGEF